MNIFSKIIFKILKDNTIRKIQNNKNSSIGQSFRIGNYANISLYDSSTISFGNNVDIRNSCHFFVGKDAKLLIEDNVFMNNFCSINVMDQIKIGENTLFGEGVKLYDHNHEYNHEKVEHQKFNSNPISIGKNCWLGSNVIVLKGVTIGDNCIIGAGCLVYKDIPPFTKVMNKSEHIVKPI